MVKLNVRKTAGLLQTLCAVFALIVRKESAEFLQNIIEPMQPGLFLNVFEKLYIPNFQTVPSKKGKLLAIDAAVKILSCLIESSNISLATSQIEAGVRALQKSISKEILLKNTNEAAGDAMATLLEQSDSLDVLAAIGGLNYNRLAFGPARRPIDRVEISPEQVKSSLVAFVGAHGQRFTELKSSFEELSQSVSQEQSGRVC